MGFREISLLAASVPCERRRNDVRRHFMTDYELKLDTWQWRQRSYRIRERDSFACTRCPNKGELHVHHLKYTTPNPWDEPGENLTTLCALCHFEAHRNNLSDSPSPEIKSIISALIRSKESKVNLDVDIKLQSQIDWARNRYFNSAYDAR